MLFEPRPSHLALRREIGHAQSASVVNHRCIAIRDFLPAGIRPRHSRGTGTVVLRNGAHRARRGNAIDGADSANAYEDNTDADRVGNNISFDLGSSAFAIVAILGAHHRLAILCVFAFISGLASARVVASSWCHCLHTRIP